MRGIQADDANLSIRLDYRRILITPSGIRNEEITPESAVVIADDGNVISGEGRASRERKIHLKAYPERRDTRGNSGHAVTSGTSRFMDHIGNAQKTVVSYPR